MIQEENNSLNKGIMPRLRLNALIQEGLQRPVVVVLAGPGYGKTQAMTDYLSTCKAKTVWIRLCKLDNLASYFWNHLISRLQLAFPRLAADMQSLGFPDTISNFEAYAQLLAQAILGTEQIVWIFDDFGEISDAGIKNLFDMLMNLELPNFHLVLISNNLADADSVVFRSSRQSLILTDDLRFTKNEISELYRLNGISLEKEELENLERYTEGWALPLHLLVQKRKMTKAIHLRNLRKEQLSERVISEIFEERFFSAYTWQQQKLLLQLSLLDFFTKQFMVNLYKGDADELTILKNNVFIKDEISTGRYFFHRMYRIFLRERLHLLEMKEKQQTWREAAEYYEAAGDTMEAITCYGRCGDHVNMLQAIIYAATTRFGIGNKTALFFLEHLDLLSAEELNENPIAESIRALIYINIYQLDKAEELVLELERKLPQIGSKDALSLLGEVYILHGLVCMMRAQENFGYYYQKAAAYLPEGSGYLGNAGLRVCNQHSFFMPDNNPGAKERIERAIHYGVPWMIRVMRGSMSGMAYVFSSEAAYLSNQLKDAQQHAYRAIYEAKAHAQHDLVCNAYLMLSRVALLQGDFDEMVKNVQNIVTYAGEHDASVLKEIRDTALAWYYIKLRDIKRIPQRIKTMSNTYRSAITYGRIQIVYANYLFVGGEYTNLVSFLEHLKSADYFQAISQDKICLYVLLAVAYQHLGQGNAAVYSLWMAYDMCYHNGLITLFIEAGENMIPLVALAREQDTYIFEASWLDTVEREAAAFAKGVGAVCAVYRKKNPENTAKNNPLSKREQEVLQAIARGLTREEIAVEQHVSVNTVKSTIRNIYNKLAANNKAEAVAIAITQGYIGGRGAEWSLEDVQ